MKPISCMHRLAFPSLRFREARLLFDAPEKPKQNETPKTSDSSQEKKNTLDPKNLDHDAERRAKEARNNAADTADGLQKKADKAQKDVDQTAAEAGVTEGGANEKAPEQSREGFAQLLENIGVSPEDKENLLVSYDITAEQPSIRQALVDTVKELRNSPEFFDGVAMLLTHALPPGVSFRDLIQHAEHVKTHGIPKNLSPSDQRKANAFARVVAELKPVEWNAIGKLNAKMKVVENGQKEAVDGAQKAELERTANAILEQFNLATATSAERDIKTGQVMLQYGVNVQEGENGKLVATAPNSTGETMINKFIGIVILIISRITNKFEAAKGKKKPEEKPAEPPKDVAPTLEEAKASEDRVQEEVKSGKSLGQIRVDREQKKSNAETELQTKLDKIKTLEGEAADPRGKIEVMKKEMKERKDMTSEEKTALEGKIKEQEDLLKGIEERIKTEKQGIEAVNKQIKEAAMDLATIAKREKARTDSIAKDGKWHRADEVKDGMPGWSYKIGPDGRSYTTDGALVQVFSEGKWQGIAKEAKITDTANAKKYTETFLGGGDQAWVKIASGDADWEYKIDLKTKTLIAKKGDQMKQYEQARNTWVARAESRPGAAENDPSKPSEPPKVDPGSGPGSSNEPSAPTESEKPAPQEVLDLQSIVAQKTLDDTKAVVQGNIEYMERQLADLEKDMKGGDWGKTFNSVWKLGGLLGKTISQDERAKFETLQRVLLNTKELQKSLETIPISSAGLEDLKIIRKKLGIAELPRSVVADYDLFQKKVREGRRGRSNDLGMPWQRPKEDAIGTRVVPFNLHLDDWMREQAKISLLAQQAETLKLEDYEHIKSVLPFKAVYNGECVEMQIEGDPWILRKRDTNIYLFIKKEDPSTSLMVNISEMRAGGFGDLAKKAIEYRKSEEDDKARMGSGFEIAGDNEPMAYIELADRSDKLTSGIQRSAWGFPEVLASRYRLYKEEADALDLSQSANPLDSVRQRLTHYHSKGVRNFYLNVFAHGSHNGMHFGKDKAILGASMTDLFEEFKDCRFTLNSVSCFGGGMNVAMENFRDTEDAQSGRVAVFTQTKDNVVNFAPGSRYVGYSTIYNEALARHLMQGVNGRPGKKLTYGEAHLLADKEARKIMGTDAQAQVSRPGRQSVKTADTSKSNPFDTVA